MNKPIVKRFALLIVKKIGGAWCLIVHGLILDKFKTHKAYKAEECQKCGRRWVI